MRVLNRIGLGENYVKATKAIYKDQKATLIVNSNRAEDFKVERGTRQGFLFSPLLFIMVLEILFLQVKVDPEILGLKCKGHTFKYRAFADDILFIVESPLQSFPILIEKIKEFGEVAGFYLNISKSKIM